ncbi:aldo/keto reductase [Rubrobacter xylanophilus DSM 9941]|uniref:Aldo/keto reductase n=1 Tax=Rubrobacter xylanophilus (strain DSM 9941 / JCM 11954 / NBRC 16129 / PRD-1) TaxID=266117 RepID=Q1AUD3_RUBXD|nr:aldo/keto reductase [Rubrobacter xylanophilus]ABG04995.1 aldo/keto reductase [Rubrobacter xylanophilus DSM 9941]
MEKRAFGRTGMEITPVGFGSWAIGGGGWAAAWGPQDDEEAVGAIRRALELGMNWIDTAAVYGLGHSEELVARALRGVPEADRPYVFTKCSLVWDEDREVHNVLKKDSVKRECEDSLRRLQVDAIDLYQIHWPNPDEDIEEGWEALVELRDEGKVRHIGVSNFDVGQMERVGRIAPVETLQPPYNLIDRGVEEEVLPYCRRNGIGVIVYSPMKSGLLTGKMTPERVRSLPDDDWRRDHPDFNEPRLSKNLRLVEKLREVGERHGRSPGEVAIAWTLRHPAVTAAIVGGRRPEQVDGIIGAAGFRLPEEEIREIEAAVPA